MGKIRQQNYFKVDLLGVKVDNFQVLNNALKIFLFYSTFWSQFI